MIKFTILIATLAVLASESCVGPVLGIIYFYIISVMKI